MLSLSSTTVASMGFTEGLALLVNTDTRLEAKSFSPTEATPSTRSTAREMIVLTTLREMPMPEMKSSSAAIVHDLPGVGLHIQ